MLPYSPVTVSLPDHLIRRGPHSGDLVWLFIDMSRTLVVLHKLGILLPHLEARKRKTRLHEVWELWRRPSAAEAEHFWKPLSQKWSLSDMLSFWSMRSSSEKSHSAISWSHTAGQVGWGGAQTAWGGLAEGANTGWIYVHESFIEFIFLVFLFSSWRYFCFIKCTSPSGSASHLYLMLFIFVCLYLMKYLSNFLVGDCVDL